MEKNPTPERLKVIKLIKEIRRSDKYQEWRAAVIRRDLGTEIPRRIHLQVHHKKEISDIIYDNKIRTLKQAYACRELWDMSNAVTLKRGEHFILTKLRRYKYITKGFREFILEWLSEARDGLKKG